MSEENVTITLTKKQAVDLKEFAKRKMGACDFLISKASERGLKPEDVTRIGERKEQWGAIVKTIGD